MASIWNTTSITPSIGCLFNEGQRHGPPVVSKNNYHIFFSSHQHTVALLACLQQFVVRVRYTNGGRDEFYQILSGRKPPVRLWHSIIIRFYITSRCDWNIPNQRKKMDRFERKKTRCCVRWLLLLFAVSFDWCNTFEPNVRLVINFFLFFFFFNNQSCVWVQRTFLPVFVQLQISSMLSHTFNYCFVQSNTEEQSSAFDLSIVCARNVYGNFLEFHTMITVMIF